MAIRLPRIVASVQATAATLMLCHRASVKACWENGCSQLSNVKPSHDVLNLPVGSLNVNTAIVHERDEQVDEPADGDDPQHDRPRPSPPPARAHAKSSVPRNLA